jgi:hypothetical protein
MAQIIDTYKNSKIAEKNAPSQKTDFIKPKVGGLLAVKGFTSKALIGNSDYNLDDKVLSAARKGQADLTKYSDKIKR